MSIKALCFAAIVFWFAGVGVLLTIRRGALGSLLIGIGTGIAVTLVAVARWHL